MQIWNIEFEEECAQLIPDDILRHLDAVLEQKAVRVLLRGVKRDTMSPVFFTTSWCGTAFLI
jgi:hypothetical protein